MLLFPCSLPSGPWAAHCERLRYDALFGRAPVQQAPSQPPLCMLLQNKKDVPRALAHMLSGMKSGVCGSHTCVERRLLAMPRNSMPGHTTFLSAAWAWLAAYCILSNARGLSPRATTLTGWRGSFERVV